MYRITYQDGEQKIIRTQVRMEDLRQPLKIAGIERWTSHGWLPIAPRRV